MPGTQSASHEAQSENHQKPEPKQAVDLTPEAVSTLTGSVLETGSVPLSPNSRLNPTGVRALQRTIGNRAVSQLLEQGKRQPGAGLTAAGPIRRQVHPVLQRAEEAGTTQEAITIATTGPLKLLSDELAKSSPVAADILKYISQLGPGQRQIVQADEGTGGILDKLAKCTVLTSANMLAAVEMLNGPLAWSLKWINAKTGAAAAVSDAAYFRLVRSATSTQVEELLASTTVSPVLITNYKGSPIDLLAPKLAPADFCKYLGNSADFTAWVLQQAGAVALMMFFKSTSLTAMILALKKSSKWAAFLTALPAGNQMTGDERAGMRLMFEATIADGDRDKIFEKRFGVKETHTTEEWKTQGSSYWTAQETKEGAPVPIKTRMGRFKALFTTTTTKARLAEELANDTPNAAACLNLLASIPTKEMGEVRDDDTLLAALARVLTGDADKVKQALARLDFPAPIKAVQFIINAGLATSIDKTVYHRLLFATDAVGLAALIAQSVLFDAVKANSGINPLTITYLVTDDAALATLIQGSPKFSDWVLASAGADTYIQFIGAHSPDKTGKALVTAGKLDALLALLPGGFSLSPVSQEAMYKLFKALTSITEKKKLFKKRFELTAVGDMGAKHWTKESIERMWELVSRLPPAMLMGAFKKLMRGTDSTGSAGFSGLAGHTGQVELSFDTAKMDNLESGAFTSVGDKMRGHKIFDAGAIHEIGHTVDFHHHLSAVGTMLQTDKDLGAWKEYNPTSGNVQAEALYNSLLTDSGNPIATWNQSAKDLTKEILLKAIIDHITPSAAMLLVKNAKIGVNLQNWVQTTFTGFISTLKMAEIIEAYGDEDAEPWNNSYNKVVNERAYHRAYEEEWVSYIAAARGASKLSNYQFRDHEEYFAELFATFYLTPDDPGKIVKAWNAKAYNWFVANVDKGYSTKKKA